MAVDLHKLKTPLTAIYGYAQLLQDNSKNLTNSQKRWVEDLLKETKKMIALIEELKEN